MGQTYRSSQEMIHSLIEIQMQSARQPSNIVVREWFLLRGAIALTS